MQIHFDLGGMLCLIFAEINIQNYPLLIRCAVIVSILALLTVLFTFGTIIYNRTQQQKNKQTEDEAESLILDELNAHILVYNSLADMPENELNETVTNLTVLKERNPVFKQVLIRILVYFKHNLRGNITGIITAAYKRLDLKRVTQDKLGSGSWFTKAQGLKEMQEINDAGDAHSIDALLADKRIDVRIEAYAVLLKIHAQNAFDFLTTEKEGLSEWHQILLFDAVTKSELADIPDFKNYLETENLSMILFVIKLILHYKQFAAIPELVSLLKNKDETVRNHAICALGVLDADDAEENLMAMYPAEHNKNKSQILLAIGEIASGNALAFLSDKFLKADHYSILKSAAAAIMLHPAVLKEEMITSLSNLDEEQEAMIKHFEDPLIRLHGVY